MIREIPEGAELLSTGLYVHRYQIVVGGVARTLGALYSIEGYCFYDAEAEVYDNGGNLIPPEEVQPNDRMYMQFRTLSISTAILSNEVLSARFISVPVQDDYEIVSVPNSNITI